jgi:hypothetical protein
VDAAAARRSGGVPGGGGGGAAAAAAAAAVGGAAAWGAVVAGAGDTGADYQAAVMCCYLVRRAQVYAEASRADALLASLATLLRTLRQLAADSLPAGFAFPSPFAPLLLDSHAAQR